MSVYFGEDGLHFTGLDVQPYMAIQMANARLMSPEFGSQTLVSNHMARTLFANQLIGLETQHYISSPTIGLERQPMFSYQSMANGLGTPNFVSSWQMDNVRSPTQPVFENQLAITDYVSDPMEVTGFEREAVYPNQMETPTSFNNLVSVNDYVPSPKVVTPSVFANPVNHITGHPYVSNQREKTRLENQFYFSNPRVARSPSFSYPLGVNSRRPYVWNQTVNSRLERKFHFSNPMENPKVMTHSSYQMNVHNMKRSHRFLSKKMGTSPIKQQKPMFSQKKLVLENSLSLTSKKEETDQVVAEAPSPTEESNGYDNEPNAPNPILEDLPCSAKLCRLAQIIRSKIKDVKYQLKKLDEEDPDPGRKKRHEAVMVEPISCIPLDDETPLPPRKLRIPTESAGQLPLIFVIPEEFLKIYAMDEESHANENSQLRAIQDQRLPWFPFSRRIIGWDLERRRRIDGRCDMYYNHKESNMAFRSIKEVTKFILANVYPRKQIMSAQESKRKYWAHGFRRRRKTPFRWEETSPSFGAGEEGGDVEGLMRADSDFNLQNIRGKNIIVYSDTDSDEETESDEEISFEKESKLLFKKLRMESMKAGANFHKGESSCGSSAVENDSEEEKDYEVPIFYGPAPAPVKEYEVSAEKVNEASTSKAALANPAGKDDQKLEEEKEIFGSLGELETNPKERLAVNLLCAQFNLGENMDAGNMFSA